MKAFADLFKKYRLRSEFETSAAFSNALAEKGYFYEESIFSHWQKGTRVPSSRHLVLSILTIFVERKAIQSLEEANQFLSSTGLGNLTEEETIKLFKRKLINTSVFKTTLVEQINRLIFFFLALLGVILFSVYAFIDVKNTVIFFTFCFNFIISVMLYLQTNRNSTMIKFLNIFAFGSSAWCLAMIFYRAAPSEYALLAAKLLYVAPIVTPTAFLLFGLFFPNEKVNKLILTIVVLCTVLMATVTLTKDLVIIDVITPLVGEKTIIFGWAYYYGYIFYYPLFFLLGYYVFFKKYLHARGYTKKQLLSLLIGMSLGSLPGMITCLIFGSLGNFEYKWLGSVSTIFWIGGVYLASVKYQLLHFYPLFQKFFVSSPTRP